MKHRRFYAFLFVSLVLFTLLMLTTLREARTQAPYQVTFTATGLDSDAGSNTVLTLGGTTMLGTLCLLTLRLTASDHLHVGIHSLRRFWQAVRRNWRFRSCFAYNGFRDRRSHLQDSVPGDFHSTGLDSDAGSNTVLTVGSTNYAYNALPSSVYVDSGTTFSWTATVSGGSGKQFVETGVQVLRP